MTAEQITIHRPEISAPIAILFKDDDGTKADFLPALDLEHVAAMLIERHEAKFNHTRDLKIVFLWKRSGGLVKGKAKLGECQKPSGLLRFLSDKADFVIWLAADHLAGFEPEQVEAALFHEMCHVGVDEDDEPQLWPHDVEMFADEVQVYGLWKADLVSAATQLRQAKLPGFRKTDSGEPWPGAAG